MKMSRRSRSVLALAVGGSVSSFMAQTRSAHAQQNPNDLVVFHNTTHESTSSGGFVNGTYWNASTSIYSTMPYSNGGNNISSGTVPTAGFAYVQTGNTATNGGFVDTPNVNGGSNTFQGDSLTIIPTAGQVNIASTSTSINNQCDQFAVLSLEGSGTTFQITTIGTAGATSGGLILANGGAIADFGNGFNELNGHINLVPAGVTMDGITTGGSGNPTPSGGIIDTRNNTDDVTVLNATITGAGLLHVLSSGVNSGIGAVLFNASNVINSTTTDSVNNFTGGILLDNTTPFNSSVSQGSLNYPLMVINNPYALGYGPFTVVSVNAGPIISNSTGAPETIATNNLMQWNGSFEYGSTGDSAFTMTVSPLDLGSGAVTLGGNVTIQVNSSTLQDDGSIASGTGGPYTLSKSGAGTLNLTGGSIAVPVTLTAGVLNLSSANVSANVTASGGTLNLSSALLSGNLSVTAGAANVSAGSITGNVTVSGGTLYALSGTTSFGGTVSVSSGGVLELYTSATTFASQPSIASGGTLALAVGPSNFTNAGVTSFLTTGASSLVSGSYLGIDTTAGNFSIPDNITGSFGVNKLGTNTLTLSGSNAYTGPTLVTAGTLVVGSGSAIPLASTVTLSNGAILDIAPAVGTGTLNSFPISSTGAIVQVQSDVAVAGPGVNYTLGSASLGAISFNVAAGSNVVGGSPGITIGTLSLSASSGTTTLNPNSASLTVGAITPSAGSTHTITLNGTYIGSVTGAITNGTASGATTFVKNGSSIWSLSGTSTYTGSTTITNGELILTGQINNTTTLAISNTASAGAALYQSGASSSLSLLTTSASQIGDAAGAAGYYSLNGGTLNIGTPGSGGELDVAGSSGGSGTFGEFDVTGGATITLPIAGSTSGPYFAVSKSTSTGEAGVFNLINGTVQLASGTQVDKANNGLAMDFYSTSTGSEVATVTIGSIGGTGPASFLTPTLTVKVNDGSSAANYSTINLDGGGTLQTLGFNIGSGSAAQLANTAVNFNGGKLVAGNASNGTFLRGLGGVWVYSAGGTIDNNGQSITISQPLLAPSFNGVTGVAVSNPGSGYFAPPKVIFSGTGGTEATGYATINSSGGVTGVVITNPGTGYTSAPTATITGIGGTGVALGTVTVAPNVGGGLIFQGSGTTTLNNSSTYTGTTNISAGTLVLDHSGTLTGSLASPVSVGSAGTFLAKGYPTVGGLTLTGNGSTVSLVDGSIDELGVNGALNISAGSVISLDIGATAGSNDIIAATGPATVTGVSTINLGTTPIANGSYTLLAASGGFNAGTGSFVVGTHPTGRISFAFNGSMGTSEVLTVGATAFASTDYWTGNASRAAGDSANNWSAGTISSNFSIDPLGFSDQNQVPGAPTDVYFTATSANSSSSTLSTQLDAAYTIKGLFFAVPTLAQGTQVTSTVINLNGYTFTLGSTANGADGLTLTSSSLSSGTVGVGSLVLGTSQNWANNNSTLPLTVNANISSGTAGTTLTLNGTGAGGVTLGGAISDGAGPLAVAFAQAGTTTLAGSNTFSGGSTINSGTVALGNNAGFGAGPVTVNGGTVDLAGYTPTFTALNGSGGTITSSIAGAVLTVNSGTYAGAITDGAGPVSLVKATAGTLVLSGSSTYSGTTNISAGTLQVGATNALSPNSTHLIGSTGTLDLNSYAAKISGLTGSGVVTNSNASGTSLLTLQQPSGTSVFSGVIKDGNGPVALSVIGSGNQVLSGANAFSGGSNVSSGTLTVSSNTALGSGPVTLSGGTLSLVLPNGSPHSAISTIAAGTGPTQFNLTQGILGGQWVGTAVGINGGVATLTDTTAPTSGGFATEGENTSIFTNSPISLGGSVGFVAKFTYQASPNTVIGGYADGATFTIQNDTRGSSALGNANAYLGYGNGGNTNYPGITPSAAIELNLYGAYTVGTAYQTSGALTSTYTSVSGGSPSVNLLGDPINVTITYSASANTLTETLTDQTTGGVYNHVYTGVNLSSVVGGTSAYIGFTGGTGGYNAVQNVSNFTFANSFGPGPASIANNVTAQAGTASTIQLGVANGSTGGAIGSLTINNSALVSLTALSQDSIATYGGLSTTGLSIAGSTDQWTGKLDLTNNALDVSVSTANIATITNQVKQGYAGGSWQGSGGITSSVAAADSKHLTAVGAIINDAASDTGIGSPGTPLFTSFDGTTSTDGDVLVKYTYYGDTNLSGVVDGSDYANIDNAYENNLTAGPGSQLTGWYNGDFNYDGVVDGSDYTLMDNAFNQQGVSLTASIATPTAQIGGGSAVPEPASLGLIGLAACGMLGRRRAKSIGRN